MAVKDPEELIEAAEAQLAELTAAMQRLVDESREVRRRTEDEALQAFAETVREVLGDDRVLSVDAARRAALLAAAEQAWEGELGPMLSTAQVRQLLGDVSRQRVDELLRAHRLIGLRDGSGRRRYPAFQFRDGRAIDALVAAYQTIASATASEWTAASWCVAPDGELDGKSPAQWARDGDDPDRLATIAGHDAARLAQ